MGDDYLPVLGTSTSTTDPDTAPVAPEPEVAAVLVVVRDPDAPTQVNAYTADGAVVQLAEVVVDPGWGWTRTEWDEARADVIASVPEAVRGAVADVYAAYAGNRYISDDGGNQ